ncbi:TPA: methyl-accepting chemotaxis protein [Aeromonas salmonicida]
MNTSTMTIGKKLTAGFAVLGLMVAFIGGFSLLEFSNMNRAAIGFTDSILPAVNRTSAIGESISELRRYELGFFLVASDPQKKAEYRSETSRRFEQVAQQLVEHDATIWAEDVEERRTFDTVKADWARYAALHQRVKQLQDSDQLASAQQVFMSEGIPLYLNLTKSVSDLIRINHGYAKASRKVVVAAYDSAKLSVTVSLLVGLVLVVGLSVVLTRQIRDPLIMLARQAQRIANGDLGKGELQEWIQDNRFNRDELGQLGSALNRMQNALANLVSEIAGSVSQLSSAVEEVSAISEQSATGMARQQSEVSQVATAMNEMQSTVNEVARNTTDAMSAAKDASHTSAQGNQVVRSAISSIEDVSVKIEQAGAVVQQLETDSAMQLSRQQMQASVGLARDAGSSIDTINGAVTQITDMNTLIATATEEQNAVTEELNRSIVNIHNAADENAQGAQQTAQACVELSKLATSLHHMTQRFTL